MWVDKRHNGGTSNTRWTSVQHAVMAIQNEGDKGFDHCQEYSLLRLYTCIIYSFIFYMGGMMAHSNFYDKVKNFKYLGPLSTNHYSIHE